MKPIFPRELIISILAFFVFMAGMVFSSLLIVGIAVGMLVAVLASSMYDGKA